MIRYYQVKNVPSSFSRFADLFSLEKDNLTNKIVAMSLGKERLLDMVAYCIMPTHVHFVLKQLQKDGITIFMRNTLNSYTRYFNLKHKRKGPLWEGRFKTVLVKADEYLLHLTRYLHLNPTSAGLVSSPDKWPYSSYSEYIETADKNKAFCKYKEVLDISADVYKEFTEDRVSYQAELQRLKASILE